MNFNLGFPFQYSQDRFDIEPYFNDPPSHMPAYGYILLPQNERRRQVALRTILKNSKCKDFDPFVPFLAMNYFDRFLSRSLEPRIYEEWIRDTNLLAISCLSIASKMRSKSFKLSQFLKDKRLRITTKEVLVVELKILDVLRFDMRSFTALCFPRFFFGLCWPDSHGIGYQTFFRIVTETQDDIRFTKFPHSLIAASALLAAHCYLYPQETYQQIETRFMSCERIHSPYQLIECIGLIQEMFVRKKIWPDPAEIAMAEIAMETKVARTIQLHPLEEEYRMPPNFDLKWETDESLDSVLNSCGVLTCLRFGTLHQAVEP